MYNIVKSNKYENVHLIQKLGMCIYNSVDTYTELTVSQNELSQLTSHLQYNTVPLVICIIHIKYAVYHKLDI